MHRISFFEPELQQKISDRQQQKCKKSATKNYDAAYKNLRHAFKQTILLAEGVSERFKEAASQYTALWGCVQSYITCARAHHFPVKNLNPAICLLNNLLIQGSELVGDDLNNYIYENIFEPFVKFHQENKLTILKLSPDEITNIRHEYIKEINAHQPHEINQAHLINSKRLTFGGFGIVYKSEWNGLTVAVKKIHQNEVISKDFENEKSFLYQLSQGNPCHFVNFFGFGTDAQSYYLVMEYMCFTAKEVALSRNFNHSGALKIVNSTILGLQYMHARNRLHVDLKPDNILVNDAGEVKLADFGLSIEIQDPPQSRLYRGMTPYRAPELRINTCALSKASDMYSFGVTAYDIFHRNTYAKMDENTISGYENKHSRPRVSKKCSKHIAYIIKQTWRTDPAKRLTADECVERLRVGIKMR